jgi:hypothetical protein
MLRARPHATDDAAASAAGACAALAGVVVAIASFVARAETVRRMLATLALLGAIAGVASPGLEGRRPPHPSQEFDASAAEQGAPIDGACGMAASTHSPDIAVDDPIRSDLPADEPTLPSLEHDEDDEPLDEPAVLAHVASPPRLAAVRSRSIAALVDPLRVSAGFASRRERPPHA